MNSIPHRKINPHVSVDCVVFGFDNEQLKALIIERENSEGKRVFALPGNLIFDDETLDEAANRVLFDLTKLDNLYLKQFHCFGNPDRVSRASDKIWLKQIREFPDARVVTVAYYSLVKHEFYTPHASGFATEAKWCNVSDIPSLAFDHNEILNKALENLKSDLIHLQTGIELLPKKFTLAQLQKLYELILQTNLDKRNFRRKMLKNQRILPLTERQKGVNHKPAQFFEFNKTMNIDNF